MKIKNKKSIIALVLLLSISIVVGITNAFYHAKEEKLHNKDYTGYKFAYEMVYDSKSDTIKWNPNDQREFAATLENTGDINFGVRFTVNETWYNKEDDSPIDRSNPIYNSKMFVVNTDNWYQKDNYYYYHEILTPGATIEKFIEYLINDTTNIGSMAIRTNTYDEEGESILSKITYETGTNVYYMLKLDVNIVEEGYDWTLDIKDMEYDAKATPASCFTYNGYSFKTITNYDVEACGTDVIIPKKIENVEVAQIGTNAFSNKGLTSVIIPEGIKSIGQNAFRENQITELEIPSTVTSINLFAFYSNNIKKLILHEGLSNIGGSSFWKNQITELEIPSTVKIIGAAAFMENKLETLILSQNLETIGDNAFSRNQITGTLEIPSKVKSIGQQAFQENQIENLILHEGLEEIKRYTFKNNKITGTLEIPSTVKSIGYESFFNSQIKNLILLEGLETIEMRAFSENQITGTLEIPSTVKSIGQQAFKENQIESLILHEGLEEIYLESFANNSIKIIPNLPNSVIKQQADIFANQKTT